MQYKQATLQTFVGARLDAGSPWLFMKCSPENDADTVVYTESGADAALTILLKLPVSVTLLFVTLRPTSLLPGPKISEFAEGGSKVTPADA